MLRPMTVPRSPWGRAFLFASPLIGILFADKAFKLAAAGRIDNIAPLPQTLLPLLALPFQYRPLVVCLAIPVIGLALAALLRRLAGRFGALLGWLLALPLAVAVAVLEGALRGGAAPGDAEAWQSAIGELR